MYQPRPNSTEKTVFESNGHCICFSWNMSIANIAKAVHVWLSTHLHSTLFELSRVILSVKVLFLSISFFRKNTCADNPCANNATCQSSFTNKIYQCLCPAGYKGPRCQTGNQKNPLYRSSEIFNSIIKKHSSRTTTKWTCERVKARDTQRKVNWHADFLNLKLASQDLKSNSNCGQLN